MKRKYFFNPKQLLLIILVTAVGLSGCKKFLDVNDNPNNPDKADPTLLLPISQAAIGQIVGNAFQIYGNIWAQYWTQNPTSSQYKTIDQYNVPNSAFDRPWANLYRGALLNADLILQDKGESLQHIKGIAYLMKAYAFQLTTDAFGDIPLSEALKGNEFGKPKYDTQSLVYDSIFNYIDKGLVLIGTPTALSPGAQDLVFQGNMVNWKNFANTLKLRAYLRLAYIDAAKAKAGIEALYATNPTFLTADASIRYSSTGGNENPLYNEMASPTLNRIQNVVASGTIVKALKKNDDPRLFKLYDIINSDTIAWIPQGSFNEFTTKLVSPPSALVGARATSPASATAPVKLISASESYFLQAEAHARGWATGGVLQTLFEQGVRASFVADGLTDTQASTYLATAPDALTALAAAVTVEDQVKTIITQKYYAMCGFQGFEAWVEWRRTSFPDFFVTSAAYTANDGKKPLRMEYPNTEVTSNLNFPGIVRFNIPVWWDKQ